MLSMLIFACQPSKSDTAVPLDTDTADDTGIVELMEIDADGDGYPLWSSTLDVSNADCDDNDPTVTPLTERYIPAGIFQMGENNTPFSGPAHDVLLSDYCIDTYEVTNTRFADFLQDFYVQGWDNVNPAGQELYDLDDDDDVFPQRIERVADGYGIMLGYEEHPVTEVFLWSGHTFCEWDKKSLPTEAQWEKAARGTDGRTFPWGEEMPNCDLTNFGFIGEQCIGDTVAVGSYPDGVSPYGVHDMAGNVAEWVSDWFGMDYYAQSPLEDPQGPDSGWFDDGQGNAFEARVVRSGNHATGTGDIQTHYRQPEPPQGSSNGIGFRCVRPLDE